MITILVWSLLQLSHAKDMVEVANRPLRTTVMHQSTGMVAPDSKGALVLFGGTGAKSKAFGIAASMAPIANKARNLGFSPVAFQNPLYYDDHLSDEDRYRAVGPYRTTATQVKWLNDCARTVVDELQSEQRLILGGRSTGSSLILESLHRYLSYNAFADVFRRVEHVLIMGPVDPRPEQTARWFRVEYEYLSKLTDVFDKFAHDATTDLFAEMGHASQFAERPGAHVPDVTFVVGVHDALSSIDEQIEFATAFQRMHPQVAVRVIATDTSHNPASSVEYRDRDGETVKVRAMKRLSPILKQLITALEPLAPGLTMQRGPELDRVVDCGVHLRVS